MKPLKVFLLLFILTAGPVLAEQIAVLPEVMKVNNIFADDQQMYVVENTTIYVYSLTDFKLIKKFGKAGEGPQEFMAFVVIKVQPDHLLINSLGKLSYYKKDGTFIKEFKSHAGMLNNLFYPLKDGFVGASPVLENQVAYVTINWYNANLEKANELYRMKSPIQPTGKIELLKQTFLYNTYDNKIFFAGKEDFSIEVLDHTGKLMFAVQQKYEPRKFTDDDEKGTREALKVQFSSQYEAAKDRIAFPSYYPAIQIFFISDDKLYVVTWKKEGDKVEFFIFDLQGKLLKQVLVPFAFSSPIQPYPLDVRNGKFYQVTENEEEHWELHINEIK